MYKVREDSIATQTQAESTCSMGDTQSITHTMYMDTTYRRGNGQSVYIITSVDVI